MDNLRLILILIGLAVLAAIWLLHRPEGSSRKPGASRREDTRREPFIGDGSGESGASGDDDSARANVETGPDEVSGRPRQTTLPDLGTSVPEAEAERPQSADPEDNSSGNRADSRADSRAGAATASPVSDHRGLPPERDWREPEEPRRASARSEAAGGPKIVTLYVRARDDRSISGLSLLDAAIKAGLRFGEMKIFHRRHRGATKPVFSMANITRPGSFDPAGWNLFQTPGVTLFMTLPGPTSALDAWDAMLATGRRLAELLDADLMDDAQCLLTRQRVAQIREDMREFDRKHGLKT